MAKTVRNVMTSVSKNRQLTGMTLNEIRTELMLAGYGLTKADKRAKELLASAQIQTDGRTNEKGEVVYFFIYWPFAWHVEGLKLDTERVGAIEYVDQRHTILRRLDGREQAWLLE